MIDSIRGRIRKSGRSFGRPRFRHALTDQLADLVADALERVLFLVRHPDVARRAFHRAVTFHGVEQTEHCVCDGGLGRFFRKRSEQLIDALEIDIERSGLLLEYPLHCGHRLDGRAVDCRFDERIGRDIEYVVFHAC